MLEAVKVWPGKGEACRKVGATANLAFARIDLSDARVGMKKRTLRSNQETDEGKRCAALANSLTKKAPYKGLGADSEEKHEPVSDIDTVVVDNLKALDPERPIREAKVDLRSSYVAEVPRADLHAVSKQPTFNRFVLPGAGASTIAHGFIAHAFVAAELRRRNVLTKASW